MPKSNNPWIEALKKQESKTGKYVVPEKGSVRYIEAKKIMQYCTKKNYVKK